MLCCVVVVVVAMAVVAVMVDEFVFAVVVGLCVLWLLL